MRLKQTLIALSHILHTSSLGWYISVVIAGLQVFSFVIAKSHLHLTCCSCPLLAVFPQVQILNRQWYGLQTSLQLWDHGNVLCHPIMSFFHPQVSLYISRPLRFPRIPHHCACKKLNNSLFIEQLIQLFNHKQSSIFFLFFQSHFNITTQIALLF